jgi:hypothetical protein
MATQTAAKKAAAPTPAATEESKPAAKRTMLTPQQRIEKLEAELKAAREKAEAKANAAANQAKERKAKLVAKRDALNEEIAKLDAIIGDEPAAPAGNEDSEG